MPQRKPSKQKVKSHLSKNVLSVSDYLPLLLAKWVKASII